LNAVRSPDSPAAPPFTCHPRRNTGIGKARNRFTNSVLGGTAHSLGHGPSSVGSDPPRTPPPANRKPCVPAFCLPGLAPRAMVCPPLPGAEMPEQTGTTAASTTLHCPAAATAVAGAGGRDFLRRRLVRRSRAAAVAGHPPGVQPADQVAQRRQRVVVLIDRHLRLPVARVVAVAVQRRLRQQVGAAACRVWRKSRSRPCPSRPSRMKATAASGVLDSGSAYWVEAGSRNPEVVALPVGVAAEAQRAFLWGSSAQGPRRTARGRSQCSTRS
jgi:hypothetical protein